MHATDDYVERLIEYAGRHSLEPYRAVGLGLKGAVAIARDELETGIELLRSALETLITLRLNIFVTDFMGALADGLRKHGQVEEAVLTINQAIGRRYRSRIDMPDPLRKWRGSLARSTRSETSIEWRGAVRLRYRAAIGATISGRVSC